MPRAKRILVSGAVYHVYNRVARGEHLFREESEASRLVARIAETEKRDELMERYGFLLVNSMAAAFSRSSEMGSPWIGRRVRGRQEDGEYRSRLEEVDRAVASAGGQVS